MASEYTPSEMMAFRAAAELHDGNVVFVGIGLPNLACNLARATHAPGFCCAERPTSARLLHRPAKLLAHKHMRKTFHCQRESAHQPA